MLFVVTDITITEGRSAVFAVRKDFDIVVANAGSPPPGDFRDWGRDVWTKADDANMLTPIELIKATVDGMAARGFMQHAGGLPDRTKRAGRWWGLSTNVSAFLV